MYTQNYALKEVTSVKYGIIWPFLVSMLKLWGVGMWYGLEVFCVTRALKVAHLEQQNPGRLGPC